MIAQEVVEDIEARFEFLIADVEAELNESGKEDEKFLERFGVEATEMVKAGISPKSLPTLRLQNKLHAITNALSYFQNTLSLDDVTVSENIERQEVRLRGLKDQLDYFKTIDDTRALELVRGSMNGHQEASVIFGSHKDA
jgi:hypothetical protein